MTPPGPSMLLKPLTVSERTYLTEYPGLGARSPPKMNSHSSDGEGLSVWGNQMFRRLILSIMHHDKLSQVDRDVVLVGLLNLDAVGPPELDNLRDPEEVM